MKKTYETPVACAEEFMPNEYVAACFQLVCHRGSEGNHYPDSYWNGPEIGNVSHSTIGTPHTCGDASANRVITSDGGVFQSVGEYNGEQGWLNGSMTKWTDNDKSNSITPGDTIFWYTKASGKGDRRKWNHWGYLSCQYICAV